MLKSLLFSDGGEHPKVMAATILAVAAKVSDFNALMTGVAVTLSVIYTAWKIVLLWKRKDDDK